MQAPQLPFLILVLPCLRTRVIPGARARQRCPLVVRVGTVENCLVVGIDVIRRAPKVGELAVSRIRLQRKGLSRDDHGHAGHIGRIGEGDETCVTQAVLAAIVICKAQWERGYN